LDDTFRLPGLGGKVALVTGAGRGQGRSHAVRFAQCGVDCIVLDICADVEGVPYPMASPEDLAETVRLVEAEDRRAYAITADVRDFDAVKAGVDAGVAVLGGLDIVVANAGNTVQERDVPGWEVSDVRYRAVVGTNLDGVWNTIKATAPVLVASNTGGAMILISSTAGLKGMAEIPDYAAAKHGVVGLMRTFAQELAPHSIRVNTIHPTGVVTPLTDSEMMRAKFDASPTLKSHFANLLPIERLRPTDISDAVLWLASDAARYVTGVALPVDAGYTTR
jgi:SDR family mycofactocin-dependent oxidoreductase